MLGAALGIGLLATAANAQWRVDGAGVSSGATQATSTSYRVAGCVEHQPAGLASSASFTVYAGCGASAVVLPADQGGGGPVPAAMPTVPTLSEVGALLLVLALAGAGAAGVRRLSTT